MEETPLRYGSSSRPSMSHPRKSLTSCMAMLAKDGFASEDTTSTPLVKLREPRLEAHALLVSPISHATDESDASTFASFLDEAEGVSSWRGNVWRTEEEEGKSEQQTAGATATLDSGYATSDLSSGLPRPTSLSDVSFPPLSVDVSSPRLSHDPARQSMFAAVDRDFRFRWLRRDRFEIGRLAETARVDVVAALDDYDCSGFLLASHLLPLLSPCSLRRMRLVSRRWRDVVGRLGRERWRVHAATPEKRRSPHAGKENERSPLCCAVCSPASFVKAATADGALLRHGPLRTTQAADDRRPSCSRPPPDAWSRFLSATSSLLHSEHLGRCPRCGGPSRVHPASRRAVCTQTACRFDYCSFCLYPVHAGRPCRRRISPTRDEAVRRSPEKRQTKRRLKRL